MASYRLPSARILALTLAAGLTAATAGSEETRPVPERELTLGLVQKEVRVGMAQGDLVAVLGSPNILARDSEGREVWVYDKIATEARFKSRGVGAGGGVLAAPGASLLLGVLSGHVTDKTATTSQRTLTVIVRFDAAARVETLSYHASRF